KRLAGRVITPNPAIHFHPFTLRGPRLAHRGGCQNSMPPVQPTIRPPFQTINYIVAHHVRVPTIEQHFRRAVWNVVSISVRDKDQIRGTGREYSAKPDCNAGQSLPLIPKHRSLVETPRPFGILEDHNTIPQMHVVVGL